MANIIQFKANSVFLWVLNFQNNQANCSDFGGCWVFTFNKEYPFCQVTEHGSLDAYKLAS